MPDITGAAANSHFFAEVAVDDLAFWDVVLMHRFPGSHLQPSSPGALPHQDYNLIQIMPPCIAKHCLPRRYIFGTV